MIKSDFGKNSPMVAWLQSKNIIKKRRTAEAVLLGISLFFFFISGAIMTHNINGTLYGVIKPSNYSDEYSLYIENSDILIIEDKVVED